MDDKDLTKAKQAIVACSVSVFVCWEVFKHLFLMNVPMVTNHLVSGLVEAVAAVGVCALGVHLLGLVAEAKASQQTYSRVVGMAVGTSVTLEVALRDIQKVAETLGDGEALSTADRRRCADLLTQRVRYIRSALRSLARMSGSLDLPVASLPGPDEPTRSAEACQAAPDEPGMTAVGPVAPANSRKRPRFETLERRRRQCGEQRRRPAGSPLSRCWW